ncbi:MAG: putative lyase [Deltaproteobacteria bacterium ADurb.BinA179]|jgi:catechol 2,3-dioxygenase-like lactoylglutathione lyase family enzyme|nr:VOC family protein [Deltaproteobacteria bacterium]MDI9541723.1 VOC family protein [Pseudomonadota bacterium]OPZ24461.1 MAG: putative lyase [Deltaproteobacteria bacterium ADurb.BinA179]HOD70260.1 VOC family protein [Deltaproteobacteria bacterium]HOE72251.1 VOC family protein [Deltaproteobacteria bacterium]
MINHLHHVHIFASDIDKSIAFYRECFGGQVVLDNLVAGSRNVFMRIGAGRIHFYSQRPKYPGRGSVHHIGIQTDDIETVVNRLKENGVELKNRVKDFGIWKYVMVPAPDGILVELFEVDKEKITDEYLSYFE